MKKIAYGVAAAVMLLVGCHTITEELPTQPNGNPAKGSILTIPIPTIPPASPSPTPSPSSKPGPGPSPTPSPSPSPSPTPSPTPTPSPSPTPNTNGCGNPLPVVSRMNVKVHIHGPTRDTLDSTPIVHDAAYCAAVGFTDGRVDCAVRPEGAPDRQACEEYAIGRADDTNRAGPTWYRNGALCTGEFCENEPDNQYLLWAFTNGHYEACTKSDICGAVDVVDR